MRPGARTEKTQGSERDLARLVVIPALTKNKHRPNTSEGQASQYALYAVARLLAGGSNGCAPTRHSPLPHKKKSHYRDNGKQGR